MPVRDDHSDDVEERAVTKDELQAGVELEAGHRVVLLVGGGAGLGTGSGGARGGTGSARSKGAGTAKGAGSGSASARGAGSKGAGTGSAGTGGAKGADLDGGTGSADSAQGDGADSAQGHGAGNGAGSGAGPASAKGAGPAKSPGSGQDAGSASAKGAGPDAPVQRTNPARLADDPAAPAAKPDEKTDAPAGRLRLKVLDMTGKPLADTSCFVTVGTPIPTQTDAQGLIDVPLEAGHPKTGELFFQDLNRKHELKVEPLDDIGTPTGQRDRFNNLGYFAGYKDSEDPDDRNLKWAIEEFQCDFLGPKNVTGVFDDKTRAKLEEIHGS